MNREIKFRAWDKRDNEMVESNSMPDLSFWKYVAYDSTTPVMQFTGLLDKNGQEIYEGDIIASLNFITSRGVRDWLHHKIVWSNENTGWVAVNIENKNESIKINGNVQLWCYIKNDKDFEVIGNIYQNPELLETVQK